MKRYVALLLALLAVVVMSSTALARPMGGIITDGAFSVHPGAPHVQFAFSQGPQAE